MKTQVRNQINKILTRLNKLEDNSYMTFIYALKEDPWNTYKTFDIIKKKDRNGKPVYKVNGKKFTKSELIKKMNRYIKNPKLSTMIALKNSYDETEVFFDTDKNKLYEY